MERSGATIRLAALLVGCLLCLGGCFGGQEIDSCLFVLSLAVDPAQDGNLTVTVKALSGGGAQSGGESGGSGGGSGESGGEGGQGGKQGGAEQAEAGYVVLSATAPSCLRALGLLSATTPRTFNLSQLREIVINETVARTDATLSILKEIYAMFRANGSAVVVVTPDNAGDFIRRQRAVLGLRLSRYLEVLFEQLEHLHTIPPDAKLSAVIAAMESSTLDAAVVYAAFNDFENTLILPGESDIDRLPGHLPRTAPAQNEHLGTALFDGPRMTGVLTGQETGMLCLLMGEADRRTVVIDGAQFKVATPTRVTRTVDANGALRAHIRVNLARAAGQSDQDAREIAARIERDAVLVLQKLQAASCDAAGFGRIAVRNSLTIADWEARNWGAQYEQADVTARVDLRLQ